MAETSNAVATAVESLKAAVSALTAEEATKSAELAAIVNKRKAAQKALDAMSDTAPRRRRGRPRNADRQPAEAVAA
jgi:peptidoglycan hydrolase CwlO-like protein